VRTLTLALLLSTTLFADQIVLKNGDTLTGSIVKKDGDKLTIKSEFLGEVSMPWSAVKSVRSDEPLTVELPNDQKAVGKVTTEGDTLQVVTATETRTAVLSAVGNMRNPAEQRTFERLQHPGLLELWTGYFDMGLALARGNARTDTLTTNFNASRVTRHDKITLTFNQLYGSSRLNGVTSTTANALRGGWSYDRDLTRRLFVNVFNQYEHDQFQSLDLRFVLGGGLGLNAIKTPSTTLAFLGGANYARESFSTGLHRDSAEGYFGDDFLHKVSAATSITQTFRIFPNITNSGEYRVNFDVGAVTALKKWLGWQVSITDRFISNPLPGRQRNDLLLSTGLRVSFAK